MRLAFLLTLGLAATLAACSRPTTQASASAPATIAQAEKRAASPKTTYSASLAITRALNIEVGSDKVAPLFQSTQAACNADVADECVVLDARLTNGRFVSASLKLRAAPAGIRRVLEQLRGSGGVASESASAEDLAAPIADGERQIAMLREYRDSLLALRGRKDNTIDALIRINQELAQTQSQLESATGEAAHLQQRLATETLTIEIGTVAMDGSRSPVASAFGDFAAHLGEAAAAAITFVAYAIPWLVVLLPLAWLVRWLVTRRRRKRMEA